MTDQEKIDLVISAIQAAHKHYPRNCIKIELTDENKLKDLGRSETLRTLDKLQKEEMILSRYDSSPFVPKGPIIGGRWERDENKKAKIFFPYRPKDESDKIVIEDFSITISLRDVFDNWLKTRQLFKSQELKDLSRANIAGIYSLAVSSNEKFEISHRPQIELYIKENPKDYLTYLSNKGIVSYYDSEFKSVLYKVNLTLEVEKFVKFIPKIQTAYKKTLPPKNQGLASFADSHKETPVKSPSPPDNHSGIVYRISFPPSNEILLNDLVVISKPNLNSENGDIFGYLMEHPNKEITKEALEKGIDRKINKSLHKILQNLGFSKDIRKIFFTVSKNTIVFRNPVNPATIKELGVSPLRFPTK